jgi:hypothetical protein
MNGLNDISDGFRRQARREEKSWQRYGDSETDHACAACRAIGRTPGGYADGQKTTQHGDEGRGNS